MTAKENSPFYQPLCGLHSANVVVSAYNENGECKCLSCVGCWCKNCQQYKDLLDEANRNDWLRLERCINCMNQR